MKTSHGKRVPSLHGGRATSFIREKKINCGYDYLEVDLFNYTKTEKENAARGKRSKKEVESTLKQVNWNEENSRRRFLQLVHTNFGEGDYHMTLTYTAKNLPPTKEAAEQEARNYLRRVAYKREKEGLPALKYIMIPACTYKNDGVTPARIHHHIIMNGGLDRDILENLWRKRKKAGQKKHDKIGFANADRLQPNENGLAALCEYLAKQAGGKKRWRSSHNLDQPDPVRIDPDTPREKGVSRFLYSTNLKRPWSRTNDHSFSRKEIKKICDNPPDSSYWEKRYPGYTLCGEGYGFKAVYSDCRGWAVYLKLRRIKD